jgi:hypothetical protein
MKVPGIVYSLILAVGAWCVEYFTQGPGNAMSYAPIIIAVVPVLLKLVTVTTTAPTVEPSAAVSRGEMVEVQPDNKMERFLFG